LGWLGRVSATTVVLTDAASRIGGQPALDFPRVPAGSSNRALSPALVVGRGPAFNGPVEIVANDSRLGICLWLDHPRQGETSGRCSDANPATGGGPVAVNLWARSLTHNYSQWARALSPEVRRVGAFVGGRRVSGVVAQVGGRLLRRLHQPRPFGYFSVTVAGCVPEQAFRVVAYDARWRSLGSARGPSVPGACG
jgi:hypothetical protein